MSESISAKMGPSPGPALPRHSSTAGQRVRKIQRKIGQEGKTVGLMPVGFPLFYAVS